MEHSEIGKGRASRAFRALGLRAISAPAERLGERTSYRHAARARRRAARAGCLRLEATVAATATKSQPRAASRDLRLQTAAVFALEHQSGQSFALSLTPLDFVDVVVPPRARPDAC
jgi:hypothetical protein